jgi:hypothetical protein
MSVLGKKRNRKTVILFERLLLLVLQLLRWQTINIRYILGMLCYISWNSFMSPSAPAVKIQGCRGWKTAENTPIPPWGSWLLRTFNGTISGLRARSLRYKRAYWTLLIKDNY